MIIFCVFVLVFLVLFVSSQNNEVVLLYVRFPLLLLD